MLASWRSGGACALLALAAGCDDAFLDLREGATRPDLEVGAGETATVDACLEVTGQTDFTVTGSGPASTSFLPGQQLLLLQMQDAFAVSGDPVPITGGLAGQWHLAPIVSTTTVGSSTTFTLAGTLPAFAIAPPDSVVQACLYQEYESVTVAAGGALRAAPWNGSRGGVLAFSAASVTVEGRVDADAAGFRGGELRVDEDGASGVTVLDTVVPGSGGGKGEGPDSRSFRLSGRGNYASGAGGGNNHNAGGGGGGSGGAGGRGGKQYPSGGTDVPLTSGLGGAAVDLPGRLLLGGGGGAGHQNDSVGGRGGRGGGIVWITTVSLAGAGTIAANGDDGEDAGTAPNGNGDAAGGGGAGGWVRIDAGASVFTGLLSATGGVGGDTVLDDDLGLGPGGGGGGGHVEAFSWAPGDIALAGGPNGLFRGMTITTSWNATPGTAGTLSN